MTDVVPGVFAVAGASLVLLAGVGVLRFPDLYSRMHAATKAPTVGLILVSCSAIVAEPASTPKLLLAATVVFLTAPVAAHLLGRSAYRAGHVELEAQDDLAGSFVPSDPQAEERP